MKKMFALLVSILALAGMGLAAPIIGLTDRATGRGVPDADLRYLQIGTTNNVGIFSNLTVTALLDLFGTSITNVDNSILLYADGTQPMTGTGNGGSFGWTNLGTCLPGGSNTVDLGSVTLPWMTLYVGTIYGRGPFTNSGTLALSAATTGLVSVTSMTGNSWVFRKPYIYVTNTAFSAVGDWSWYSGPSFDSSSEQWRGNLEFASGTLTAPIGAGSNTVVVSDATPFISGISVTPFQIVALDGTAELLTVTNVTGSTLYLSEAATGTHANGTVVSHACAWNVPGYLNDDSASNMLRGKIRFAAAQTATFNYVIPYRRID
jgi:hypothetical protein